MLARGLQAALAACVVSLALTGIASAASWTQFRGGPTHVGVNPLEATLDVEAARGLHPACAGSSAPGTASYSSPAIWSGRAIIGSSDGRIVAFDASTCALSWSAPTGSPVYSSPAIKDGRAIVGTLDNGVHAVDARTGAPLWTDPLPGTFFGSATVAGNTAYIGTLEGYVYALDTATGGVRWSREFARTGAVSNAPTVVGGRVFVGYSSGQLRAFRASDGKSLYTLGKLGPVLGAPAARDGILYFGGGAMLYAVEAATGHREWAVTAGPQPVASSAAVSNGLVWVRTRDRTLRAFDAATGTLRIAQPMAGDDPETGNGIAYASPVIAAGVVYVTSSDARLYAFDESDGSPLASVSTFGAVWGSPAVVNGRVWVAAVDTRCLVCSFAGGS
jgi:outer membrane protein assembly factor BamB